jgi:hypothetical protein
MLECIQNKNKSEPSAPLFVLCTGTSAEIKRNKRKEKA